MDKTSDDLENPTQRSSEDIKRTVTGADGDVKINAQEETKADSNAVLIQAILRQNELLMSILAPMSLRKEEVYWSPVVIKSLPVFNGKGNSNEASNWLKILQEAAVLYRWPEASKLEVARVNLEGPAREWYTEQNFKSWYDFEQQFEMRYVRKSGMAIRWKLLIYRVQRKNEDILNYYHDKVRMCKDLDLDFKDIKGLVLDGMKHVSFDFYNYLVDRSHINEDDLTTDIMSYLESLSVHGQKEQQPSVEIDDECALVKTTQTASDCPIEKRPEGACNDCGSTTHQCSDCSKQIQKTEGMKMEGKQQIQNQGKLSGETTLRATCFVKIGLRYLNQQFIVNALIDNGSPVSLIKSYLVKDCYRRPYNNNLNMFRINRTPLDILAVVVVDTVMLDYNIGKKQMFYVVSDKTMLFGCLLGRDAIKGLDVSFGGAGKLKIKGLERSCDSN